MGRGGVGEWPIRSRPTDSPPPGGDFKMDAPGIDEFERKNISSRTGLRNLLALISHRGDHERQTVICIN